MFLSRSLVKIQYCGEPRLQTGLRPPWLQFRITVYVSYLEGSVIAVSSHHPQEVFLAQFSPLVHKSDLKTHSFHFITVWKHHSERKHALFNYLFTGMFWYNNYQECCCNKHRCYIPWGDAATIFSCFPRKERNGPWALQFAARAGTRWRKSCPVKANSSNLLLLFAFARHGRIEHFITFLETIMTDMLGWRFFSLITYLEGVENDIQVGCGGQSATFWSDVLCLPPSNEWNRGLTHVKTWQDL